MLAMELKDLGDRFLPLVEWAFGPNAHYVISILQIIGIDILLSGDNAVVIALACRSLPPEKRQTGIILGVAAAIMLRVLFTVGLGYMLGWPWLMLAGGLLLLWIAMQLLVESDESDKVIADSKTLAGAIWTIALADIVMSLDNMLAIAGAAHGDAALILFGLALSIPLIMGGATIIIGLLTRFPILVWAGAALLGWIAGELIAGERMLLPSITALAANSGLEPKAILPLGGAVGAALVILAGLIASAVRGGRANAKT